MTTSVSLLSVPHLRIPSDISSSVQDPSSLLRSCLSWRILICVFRCCCFVVVFLKFSFLFLFSPQREVGGHSLEGLWPQEEQELMNMCGRCEAWCCSSHDEPATDRDSSPSSCEVHRHVGPPTTPATHQSLLLLLLLLLQ